VDFTEPGVLACQRTLSDVTGDVVKTFKRQAFGHIRVKGLVGLALCAACAGLPPSAVAAGRSRDAAAARGYLGAARAYAEAAYALSGARIAAMEANERSIATQCPSGLAYAPRDSAFEELGYEIGEAQWIAGIAPVRSLMQTMSRAIGGLTWSDRMLTGLVRSEAAEELAYAELVAPDVCAQIEAWRASDYAELPSSVREFAAHVDQIEAGVFVGPKEEDRERVILRVLRRYEGPAERRMAERTLRLEARAGKRLAIASDAVWRRLEAAFGVSEL
jgi:hypothetical protein